MTKRRSNSDFASSRAFTQLAADNQYAALGLFLLGVLAQVKTALDMLLPPAAEEEEELQAVGSRGGPASVDASASGVAMGDAPAADLEASRGSGQPIEMEEDIGVVVSRDEVDRELQGNNCTPKPVQVHGNKKKTVASTPDPVSRTKRVPGSGAGEKAKGKKAKKRKKGDEFDDLFSSL